MSFATDQLARIEALLAANPGVESVTIEGGTSVKYSDLVHQRAYWKSEAAREAGTKPRVSTISLGAA